MSDLELYQQVIIDHNRHPRNFGVMEDKTHYADGYNPLCGDHLQVYAKVEGDRLEKISFTGEGCAICKASASLMTTEAAAMSLKDFGTLYDEFHNMLLGKLGEQSIASLRKLKVFSSVARYPSRVKCAALAWHALKGALDNKSTVSTEGASDL